MSKAITLLFCLFLFAQGSYGRDDPWKEYVNTRFGFSFRYPAVLLASRNPDNGDGREFHTEDREFSVLGIAHFLNTLDDGDGLEKRWQDELKELGSTITYKKKADTWYVISGVTKNGTEYYHKLYTKKSNWSGFKITYPHVKHKKYDPWVERIEKSFVPFLKGDYDRPT